MGTEANIKVIKPQGIYYAAVGTALPTVTGTLGSTIDMSSWTDIGFLDPKAKIKATFSRTTRKVRPVGFEGPLKGVVTQKECKLEFMGLEKTLEALVLAMGDGVIASNEMPDGGNSELAYKAFALVEDDLVYHFKKMAQSDETAPETDDDNEAMVPFVLDGYVEADADAGERMWNILKRTGA